MIIVGLTGGVASGKSLISRVWKEEGAVLIDADRIARQLVRPRSPAWRALVKAFGKEILRKDGSLHRKRLATRVFSNPVEKNRLNHILHPRIKKEIDRRIKRIGRQRAKAIIVIDAALLVETGYYRMVDKVVVVTSTPKQQMARLIRRDQIHQETARGIIDSQISNKERINVADIVIPNDGSIEKTLRRARTVFEVLRKGALSKKDAQAVRR